MHRISAPPSCPGTGSMLILVNVTWLSLLLVLAVVSAVIAFYTLWPPEDDDDWW